MENMSAEECGAMGERLLDIGPWQESEKWFCAALEKAEQANDILGQCQAATGLGLMYRKRGEVPQALGLYQQALGLAERLGEQRLQWVIYDQIGST